MKVFLRYFMLTIFTFTFFASCATSSVCAKKGCCKNKQAQTCAVDCAKSCCKK